MICAASITLHRVEGYTPLPEPVTLSGDQVWEQARRVLVGWSVTAPGAPNELDLGVSKTDFTVLWDDGDTYNGTFGLTWNDQDLPAHIRGFLTAISSPDYPEHATSSKDKAEIREYLATHQIGD